MATETMLSAAKFAIPSVSDVVSSRLDPIALRPSPIFVPHPIVPRPQRRRLRRPHPLLRPRLLRPHLLPRLRRLPPAPAVPAPPPDSPFAHLPYPSPGDRIKSDDFKALSQSLNIVYNMTVLSASLFGYTFADAKAALIGQRYSIQRVMTVFGNEISNLADTSLDSRKVIQITSAAPGDARVMIVVTEAVDTRRFAPTWWALRIAMQPARFKPFSPT